MGQPLTDDKMFTTRQKGIPTGKYEGDESKDTVAAPANEARKGDVSCVRLDLHNRWLLLLGRCRASSGR